MNIEIENIGPIKKANIELKKLTVICGKNNLGKTYLTYTVYSIFDLLRSEALIKSNTITDDPGADFGSIFLDLKSDVCSNIETLINQYFSENIKELSRYFKIPRENFKDSKITISNFNSNKDLENFSGTIENNYFSVNVMDSSVFIETKDDSSNIAKKTLFKGINKALSKIIMNNEISRPFPITSERTGIALFYKDLDLNRTQIIDYIQNNTKINILDMISRMSSNYMAPISHNINFIRDYQNVIKKKSVFKEEDNLIGKKIIREWNKLLSGSIKYNLDTISFRDKNSKSTIPIHNSSSSIKSLLILDLYIKHVAKVGDSLIIDEPELNLHPNKQLHLCKIISLIIKCGIRVILTTHSDYMLREFSNLIGMTNDTETAANFKHDKDFNVDKDDVSIYEIQKNNILKEYSVHSNGFNPEVFEDEINNQNEIFYNLM